MNFPSSMTFVKPVEELEVTHKKTKYYYHDVDLGLTIDIPEGTIPEGSVLRLKVGMALYGPFQFQIGSFPITPILMLFPLEKITLQRPITIKLPHILDQVTMHDVEALGIRVMKANHELLCAYTGESSKYIFKDMDQKNIDYYLLKHKMTWNM